MSTSLASTEKIAREYVFIFDKRNGVIRRCELIALFVNPLVEKFVL